MIIFGWLKSHWETVLAGIGGLLLFQKLLAEVFGITMLGKRIYKGAPGVWKRLMQGATDRKEINDKLDKIQAQVEYNGGKSMKDMVGQIKATTEIMTDMMKEINSQVHFNSFRADLSDISNDRMIFKLDKLGSCIFINDSFLKFFGYTEKDILKFNYESTIHPEDIATVIEKIQRAIKNKGDFYSEHRIGDVSGAYHEVIVRGYAIPDSDGDLKQFYGTVDLKVEETYLSLKK